MPPLAAVPDLERELDELYGLPLEEWTRARNDLAARLKRAHQGDQAETVRTLRKPSVAAWTVNQLARREPDRIEALLHAGERLRKAQEQALRGKAAAGDVNAAARAERDAARELVAAARAILEEAGGTPSQGMVDRISQTLRAAAVDDGARPLLERGRLQEEVSGVGFGSLRAVKPVAVRPAAPARPPRDEVKRARERVNELRAQARTLAREARDAETEAARSEREAELARERAHAAREEAERAATALANAEEELASLRR